ncbi:MULTISPECIES: hypothetical protein [unclassified Burkholderia]|uniref:hypothetical protein n=1 Tax=unclassified Burkholderia TaxID=2613784 RepID=UPI001626D3EA|nr:MULTISPECIES: hypothetical protein [unclassified Burkholderia]
MILVVIFRGTTWKPSRNPRFWSVSKNRFSILQTIVDYRSDIRQPEKRGGLRKIEITGIALTRWGRKRAPGIVGGALKSAAGYLNISYVNQCLVFDSVRLDAVMGEVAHQLMSRLWSFE